MKVLLGKRERGRVWELDVLRGIAVLAMVFDHLMFDFSTSLHPQYGMFENLSGNRFMSWLYRVGLAFEMSAFREYAHYIFVSLFLILVGISCTFSKSNGKRAFMVGYVATGIYLATALLVSLDFLDEPIVWGILQNITFNIVLYMTVEAICRNRYFMLAVGCVFIIGGIAIDWTNIQHIPPMPHGLNWWQRFCWMLKGPFANVVMGTQWDGSDYFGSLPCAGMTLVGGYIGKTFYATRRSLLPKLDGRWTIPFKWVGRHALLWYAAHQPLTMLITALLGLLCGLKLAL